MVVRAGQGEGFRIPWEGGRALRIRLSEALCEEPGKAGKICKDLYPGTPDVHVAPVQFLSSMRSMCALAEAQQDLGPWAPARALRDRDEERKKLFLLYFW